MDSRSSSRRHGTSSSGRRESKSDRKRRRSRSRSRSRSPRYSFSSSLNRIGRTRNELEIDIEVLTTENHELRGQVHNLNNTISTISLAQVQASANAANWEGEYNRLKLGYAQTGNALRDLKEEVERAVQEKRQYIDEAEKYKKERDIAELSAQSFREQISVVSERNTTLVKKCEDLVKDNKLYKEKHGNFEEELNKLRPALGEHELELENIRKQNKLLEEEVKLFKEKEKVWMAEKKDMEKRMLIKEAVITKERKKQAKVNGSDYLDVDVERKKLETVIDSLHAHYEAELKMLEHQMIENQEPIDSVQSEPEIAEEAIDPID